MGVCVNINLRDVKFKIKHIDKVKQILKEFGKSDPWWCSYYEYEDNILELLDGFRYDCTQDSEYVNFNYFNGEKLGQDEKMFELLAPYLENCEIVFYTEYNDDWKIKIKDGVTETIYREEL